MSAMAAIDKKFDIRYLVSIIILNWIYPRTITKKINKKAYKTAKKLFTEKMTSPCEIWKIERN